MIRLFLIYILLANTPFHGMGQGARIESEKNPALDHALSLYSNSIGKQAMIYNGASYREPPRMTQNNHPYFLSSQLEDGSVWYGKERFDSIPMQYDAWRDQLVVEHQDQRGGTVKVLLFPPKVERFSYLGHTFVYLSSVLDDVQAGFYELLFDGTSVKLIARRSKTYAEEMSYQGIEPVFTSKDRYFIVRGGKPFAANGKGAAIKAMEDKKKLLTQFARKEQLRFKQEKDRDLIALVRFYDQN